MVTTNDLVREMRELRAVRPAAATAMLELMRDINAKRVSFPLDEETIHQRLSERIAQLEEVA